jgi:hypothetical protein
MFFSYDDAASQRRNMTGCNCNFVTKVVLFVTCARVGVIIYIYIYLVTKMDFLIIFACLTKC